MVYFVQGLADQWHNVLGTKCCLAWGVVAGQFEWNNHSVQQLED